MLGRSGKLHGLVWGEREWDLILVHMMSAVRVLYLPRNQLTLSESLREEVDQSKVCIKFQDPANMISIHHMMEEEVLLRS